MVVPGRRSVFLDYIVCLEGGCENQQFRQAWQFRGDAGHPFPKDRPCLEAVLTFDKKRILLRVAG